MIFCMRPGPGVRPFAISSLIEQVRWSSLPTQRIVIYQISLLLRGQVNNPYLGSWLLASNSNKMVAKPTFLYHYVHLTRQL